MKPWDWIWQYIKKYKRQYIITLIASTVFAVLTLVAPQIYGRIVRDVLQEGHTEMLLPMLAGVMGVTLLKSALRYGTLISYENMSQDFVFCLRRDIYKRLQGQTHTFFDNNRVGDIMSRMTGDLDAVRHFLAYVVYAMYENVLIFVTAIILIISISWQLTLALLVAAPIIAYIAIKQAKEVKPAFSAIREQFSKLNSVCQENISGNRVVKAFTREDYEIEKFAKENEGFCQANINASKIWTKSVPLQDFIASALSVVLIVVGGPLVIWGKVELYQLVIVNGYLWAVSNPMRQVGWLINDVQRFVASLDKIFGMLKEKIDIKNYEMDEADYFETHAENVDKSDKTSKKVEHMRGDIEFSNVTFSYDKFNLKNAVLKNINFSVKAGQTVGIVGPTGSGKTTLVNLISRFYDTTEGTIKIDGTDVRDIDLESLRGGISYAMQDVFLFSDTVEGNLAYGVPDEPFEELVKATLAADADGFIKEMPDGYDTIVGERGVGLSGGQKQRLSLARALASKPAILVLDDTTSAVDMETEHAIQQALDKGYKDVTKFVIAHRISSVKSADQILVIVGGKILEHGTHDELVAKKGYYYQLFVDQYGKFAEEEKVEEKTQQKTEQTTEQKTAAQVPPAKLKKGRKKGGK